MDKTDKPEGYVFGRPTLYRPEMCEMAIEWGRQGKSKTWIAAELGICRRTMAVWEEKYPDFVVSLSRAMTLSQQWWEDAGQFGMVSDKFNNGVWNKSMSCRFPDEWRDKTAFVGGDENDKPIQQEIKFGADAFTRSIVSQHARSKDESGAGVD